MPNKARKRNAYLGAIAIACRNWRSALKAFAVYARALVKSSSESIEPSE
ncbi:MAG: hypothetical protein F6J93_12985 [Oscillatoria sp. SIO1A7]|nr:hypothetical protein [Oscillatoria sp. SIO1A7]